METITVINRGNFADYGNAYSGRYVLASWTKRVNKTYVQRDGRTDMICSRPIPSAAGPLCPWCALSLSVWVVGTAGVMVRTCVYALIVVELRWSDISAKDTEVLRFRQSRSNWADFITAVARLLFTSLASPVRILLQLITTVKTFNLYWYLVKLNALSYLYLG